MLMLLLSLVTISDLMNYVIGRRGIPLGFPKYEKCIYFVKLSTCQLVNLSTE